MRKQILFALALVLGFAAIAAAQVTTTGTITSNGACVVNTTCVRLSGLPGNSGAVSIQITGTWTGTLSFEVTADGTNYQAAQGCSSANTTVTSVTANAIVQCTAAALSRFQVRGTAAITGTATVTITSTVAAAKNAPPAAGPGSGTVTSVGVTAPITASPSPITTTGTIACATCTTAAAALTSTLIAIGAGGQALSTDADLSFTGGDTLNTQNLVVNGTVTGIGAATVGGPGQGNGQVKFKGNTSGTVTMTVNTVAGTWTWTLPTDDGTANQYLITDGNGVTSWASPPVSAVWSLPGMPAGTTTYPFFVATAALTFPDDWSGSRCKVLTNPTATWTMTIEKNGSSIGTVGVATNGVCTFATSGGATSLAAGDYLTIDTPAADATLADVMFTFEGTRA